MAEMLVLCSLTECCMGVLPRQVCAGVCRRTARYLLLRSLRKVVWGAVAGHERLQLSTHQLGFHK